jgi:hypothetical protein
MEKLIPLSVVFVAVWLLAVTLDPEAAERRQIENSHARAMLALERQQERRWQEHQQPVFDAVLVSAASVAVIGLVGFSLAVFGFVSLAGWNWARGLNFERRYAMRELASKERVLIAQAQYQHALPAHHYAPHIAYAPHTSSKAIPGDTASVPDEQPASGLPGLIDLADLDFVPSPRRLLLGLGEDGKPLTVPAAALMHTGIVGNTGGGKSNTGRLLLAQLLACKVPCVLADPHFAELDAESGEDWRPIARRLKLAPARKAGDIQDLFVWLDSEMRRRYDLREAGEKWGAPLVCYVDELPAIIANVPGAMATLAKLLQEGRKVFLYVVTSSQSLLTDVLKTPGEVRDNLRSCYYSGGAADSVVRLLDMPKRDVFTYEEQLGQGVVLLRSAATPRATLARVPLASNEGIARLLPDDLHQQAETIDIAMPRQDAGNTSVKAHTAAERRVLDMFAGGASIAEIAREISGARNGRRYTEASQQAQAVIREAVRND